MLEERNSKVHAVVGLEVDDDELVDRLLKRGKESGRSDDNLETINRRLEVYHNQTSPLREYYVTEGTYHPIAGKGHIDEIFSSIKKSIDKVKE
jgi:adenylate kinase